jgi:anti-sigma factor RsiW
MNSNDPKPHPAPEEWADYLYGELPPDQHARLDEHLRGCPACQQQAAQWRGTMCTLDSWKVPARSTRSRSVGTYVRWAVAAAAVLSLGWLGGRLSFPNASANDRLRAELMPALKQEVRQEFQAELAAAINASDQRTRDRLIELAQAWTQARQEDQQATRALYQRLDRQQRLDNANLRRDLETVAVVAQSAIGATQDQLTQLAANSLATPAGDGRLPR